MAAVKQRRANPKARVSLVVAHGFQETIYHDVLDSMGEDAGDRLLAIAKDVAKDAKANAPVRKTSYHNKNSTGKGAKPIRKKGTTPKRGKPGELKRSIRAVRAGKRYRQEGKWKFRIDRVVIRTRFYGFFVDRGWVHAKSGNQIVGTMFLTREINRRLLR